MKLFEPFKIGLTTSLSIGPRFEGYTKGLLRESSSTSFQIDMHEYGLGDSINSKGPNIKEAGLISSIHLIPEEYGIKSIHDKYKGEVLIFSEQMSSTKIYITKDILTKKVIYLLN